MVERKVAENQYKLVFIFLKTGHFIASRVKWHNSLGQGLNMPALLW